MLSMTLNVRTTIFTYEQMFTDEEFTKKTFPSSENQEKKCCDIPFLDTINMAHKAHHTI